MKFWRAIVSLLLLLLVTGCGDWEEVKRESGFKGKARLNPWLAAERFSERLGYDVESLGRWKRPTWSDAVCFVPAELLNNQGFISHMDPWVKDGGHLVVLCDYANPEWNDWSEFRNADLRMEKPLRDFLERADIRLRSGSNGKRPRPEVSSVGFSGFVFKVNAGSSTRVESKKRADRIFISKEMGEGRISVVTDARIFRSRGIDQDDRAAFLASLIEVSTRDGIVNFYRGSGVSLMELLGRHLWPLLIGLVAMLVFWLWKSLCRFGPLEAAFTGSPLRGYDHHLEALGDYQWRLDRCSSLLAPLREQIVEIGQQLAIRSGRRDADFFVFLSERSGVPRDRVVRALSETSPANAALLTRAAGDLQIMIRSLKPTT